MWSLSQEILKRTKKKKKKRKSLTLNMGNNFPLTDRIVGSTQNYYLPNMAQRSDYIFSDITE
jgi:hypothetical protein